MPILPPSLDDELSALLTDESASDAAAPPAPPARVVERLMASVGWLERFAPHASAAAEALGTDAREARVALHQLSETGGWMEIPLLPGVRIRPVTGRGGRELPGALFAEVQPGGGLPRHAHRGQGDEVMVVLQGALREVERPDVTIRPGEALRSSEDSEHTLEATGDEVCLCLVVHGGWADYLLAGRRGVVRCARRGDWTVRGADAAPRAPGSRGGGAVPAPRPLHPLPQLRCAGP